MQSNVEKVIKKLKEQPKLWQQIVRNPESAVAIQVLATVISTIEPNDPAAKLFAEVADKIQEMHGTYQAVVRSPVALSQKDTQKVTDFIHKKFGSDVLVVTKVDETLTGGLVIEYQGKEIDLSVDTQLNQLFAK